MNTSRALRGIWKEHMKPIKRHIEGFKQAKAKHNTWLPASIQGPLTRLTRDSYIRTGDLVGTDSRGNTYYMNNDYPIPRQRWVVFAEDTWEKRWDFDASDVPSEWHRWLAYMTDDPPTAYGVPPTPRKFITAYERNQTGTVDRYVPATTTRKKIESWDPEA
ncbi:Oidioi.mRNA.OKI2018_I69.PAR.g10660.t1.cds [Oikopleura dioica]|uniref:NADH dehydrogenase [ubiquinone] 1 alpha subcomplex subunit 12 n=1 Tax=Oikopleura dioica TaxID=34765 RepID=A0ABN7RSM4_OIKDI|nr:Oidioi.mRNA.OKI2018_I69.PAR.g10660.t1.cds [Oikopleura dioica]